LEDRAHLFQYLVAQLREFRATVIDDRAMHRAKNPVRGIGWTRNLEKVPAGVYQCDGPVPFYFLVES
jgi:hypothetical protein